MLLAAAVILTPLIISKYQPALYSLETILKWRHTGIVVPIGLSFFTMQMLAYLADVYRGKVSAQHNFFQYTLFISFFPQILQGPIPRYDQLEPQLLAGHKFDEKNFAKGFMLILWGFFLKLMIADKAGIAVDAIFSSPSAYQGMYVLLGGILYSIQLYADFLACTTLAQGTAGLFGICLTDNFKHPYLSTGIKEFWNRWHLSLSSWLRDYVYIPLGGNRKGKLRKYFNLCITFAVSGLWHGTGLKFLAWGLLHAAFQIAGDLTAGGQEKLYRLLGFRDGAVSRVYIKRCATFFLVMLGWILFRAPDLPQGVFMLRSLFTVCNPWILFDDSLLRLGLEWKEWAVLTFSILILIKVSCLQEKVCIRDEVLKQPFCVRCLLYAGVIFCVMLFGTYGYGYNAADFIYGGF